MRLRDSTRRSAFTLLDLLVLLVTVAIVFGFVAIAAARSREQSTRVTCASNLRQIGQALALYANDYGGKFPRTTYVPGEPSTCYTGWRAPDPFGPGGPDPNDVTAALFLLLRTQNIVPEVFICPLQINSTAIPGTTPAAPRPHAPTSLVGCT